MQINEVNARGFDGDGDLSGAGGAQIIFTRFKDFRFTGGGEDNSVCASHCCSLKWAGTQENPDRDGDQHQSEDCVLKGQQPGPCPDQFLDSRAHRYPDDVREKIQ